MMSAFLTVESLCAIISVVLPLDILPMDLFKRLQSHYPRCLLLHRELVLEHPSELLWLWLFSVFGLQIDDVLPLLSQYASRLGEYR